MKETIFIGDIHGRVKWMQIIDQHPDVDNIVFIGDYLDSFNVNPLVQLGNLVAIVEFKKNPHLYLPSGRTKTTDVNITLLIGNHDFHYLPGIISRVGTSGFQSNMFQEYLRLFTNEMDQFQMCCLIGDKLCSHAGITMDFLKDNDYVEGTDVVTFVNDLFKYQPNKFDFAEPYDKGRTYIDPYGDDVFQSPIWVRPKSLQRSNKNSFLKKDFIQIVGHTTQKNLDIAGKTTGGRYCYIDTLESNQYLIEKDGVLSVGFLN